jgi:hypothetical protein
MFRRCAIASSADQRDAMELLEAAQAKRARENSAPAELISPNPN